MGSIEYLECLDCGSIEKPALLYFCNKCFGPLDVKYDYERAGETLTKGSLASRQNNLWKYIELLPISGVHVDLGTSYTPLVKSKNIGTELGIELYIKNDTLNPTGSFKDRPVGVAINKALENGAKKVACASTGNLAAATAAWSAKACLECTIYVPRGLERGKLRQIEAYGAKIVEVNGNYDYANLLVDRLNDMRVTFNSSGVIHELVVPNSNYRPYYKEGSKTIAFESAEQLGWGLPGASFVPLGSGALFSQIYKGFKELEALGFVKNNTRMYGVQGKGASPIVNAIEMGEISPVKNPTTIAKSIAIGNPGSGYQALDIIKKSAGGGYALSDDEIIFGIKELAKKEGILSEPVGGAVIAGIRKAVESGDLQRGESALAFITGSGLKTLEVL